MLKTLKPIQLYLIAVACFIVSRLLYHGPIGGLHYVFSLVGFVFFVLAVRKYLKKK